MALPNSGPLSLDAIHVEAGGSTGSEASINDSDIRGLIGKSSGAQMSFNEWYGASNVVTISQTITTSTNTVQNNELSRHVEGAQHTSHSGVNTRPTASRLPHGHSSPDERASGKSNGHDRYH